MNDGRVGRCIRPEAINHSLKFTDITDHDFREKTILPGNAIGFDDLRRVKQQAAT